MIWVTLPLLILLVTFRWNWRRRANIHLLRYLSQHPNMHPQEFFDLRASLLRSLRHRLPEKPRKMVDLLHIDFRSEKRKWLHLPLLRGLANTVVLGRLALLATRKFGKEAVETMIPAIAVMWGLRLLQLAQAQLKIEGEEHLRERHQHALYLLNHESFLEFAIVPLLLGAELPRFLLAKDHFIDNPVLYRLLGIGRAAEAMGMVFVNRRVSSAENAKKVAAEAVKRLVDDEVPLAIFPQGTRARSTVSATGKRLGAGYYTVGKLDRLTKEGGHLKKGAAYIAVEAAKELAKRHIAKPVALIPIGVRGAAIVSPRKSFDLQLGATICIHIEEPILVTKAMIGERGESEVVHFLHQRIDQALVKALKIHGELEGRFLEIVRDRNRNDPNAFDEVFVALREWRGDDPLLYVILDFIFACKPSQWRPHIGKLVHLITNHAAREEFVVLKNALARELVK